MAALRTAHRAYREAGALNTLFAVWGFLDDHTFMTTSGDLGVVYRLGGVDAEGCDHARREAVVRQVYAGLKTLGPRYRVTWYLDKRRQGPLPEVICAQPVAQTALARRTAAVNARVRYVTTHTLVVLQTGLTPPQPYLPTRRSPAAMLQADVLRAQADLGSALASVEALWGPLRLTRLDRAGSFAFLESLAAYDGAHRATPPDQHLDFHVSREAPTQYARHLQIGDYAVKVLTMQAPPTTTWAYALEELYKIPGECILCLEWHVLPPEKVLGYWGLLQSRQRHFFFKKTKITNFLISQQDRPESEMLLNESAATTAQQLGAALKAVELEGHRFGECSLTAVLFDRDPAALQASVAHAHKALLIKDGAFLEESYNNLWAWASIMPGNYRHNHRYLTLLDINVADLSLAFSLDRGDPHPLAFFETDQQSLFGWNLHYYDVGNTLILGAIGSGKSFLTGFLITQAQRDNPLVVVIDIGHSYRKLTTILQGSYLELGGQSTTTLNPFALPNTTTHLEFLHSFVKLLLENAGDPLTVAGDLDVWAAVTNVYTCAPAQRRLQTVAQLLTSKDASGRKLKDRLAKWVGTGRSAGLFDHVDDTLSMASLQVFELGAMKQYPELLEPLLFYVLYRVTHQIMRDRRRLSLLVMDEVWTLIRNPTLREYLEKMLRMGRKDNVAIILATQTLADFEAADLLNVVTMACPTKCLLANKALDRAFYAKHLQLSEMDLDLLASIREKGQFVFKRPEVTKVLSLNVDPYSYWVYTNTPVDNAKFDAAVVTHGVEKALEILAEGQA